MLDLNIYCTHVFKRYYRRLSSTTSTTTTTTTTTPRPQRPVYSSDDNVVGGDNYNSGRDIDNVISNDVQSGTESNTRHSNRYVVVVYLNHKPIELYVVKIQTIIFHKCFILQKWAKL